MAIFVSERAFKYENLLTAGVRMRWKGGSRRISYNTRGYAKRFIAYKAATFDSRRRRRFPGQILSL
jgi:hypothetical protein